MKKNILLLPLFFIAPFLSQSQTLGEAVSSKDTVLAMKLIKEGSNPNELKDGTSLLMTACRWDNITMVSFLLRNGATTDKPRSAKGRTALMVACAYYSGITICRLLVGHGADVNAVSPNTGQTALMLAASNAKITVVDYLIKKGANPNLKDLEGKTALDYAMTAEVSDYLKNSIKDSALDKEAVIASLKKVMKP